MSAMGLACDQNHAPSCKCPSSVREDHCANSRIAPPFLAMLSPDGCRLTSPTGSCHALCGQGQGYGRPVIISQKIASTAPKAGKPKPNQVSTAVEFLALRSVGSHLEGWFRCDNPGNTSLDSEPRCLKWTAAVTSIVPGSGSSDVLDGTFPPNTALRRSLEHTPVL